MEGPLTYCATVTLDPLIGWKKTWSCNKSLMRSIFFCEKYQTHRQREKRWTLWVFSSESTLEYYSTRKVFNSRHYIKGYTKIILRNVIKSNSGQFNKSLVFNILYFYVIMSMSGIFTGSFLIIISKMKQY